MPAVVAAALALLAAAPQGEVDSKSPPRVQCRRCGSEGTKPCSKHKKSIMALERAVDFCSVAADCKRCGGSLGRDCKSCVNNPATRALARRRQLAEQWLGRQRKAIDEISKGKELLHCRDATTDLTFSLRPLTVGKKKLDSHRLMHLYIERIGALRRRFMEVFELEESAFPMADDESSPRIKVFMFEDGLDFQRITPVVTGMGAGGIGSKLMGPTIAYTFLRDPEFVPDDPAVHRNIVHNTAHLLMSNALPSAWIGNRGHGWLDEGVAHWFEFQVDGRCTTYCFEEVGLDPGAGPSAGKWKVGMRKLLELGKLRSFVDIYSKNSDQLDVIDHVHVFAYVDFLMAEGGGPKLLALINRAKNKEPMRNALKAEYGFGPLEFDGRFKKWVRSNYSQRTR